MFSLLKNHPFAVEAFFQHSVVITFAILKEQIQHLIPECLELDLYKDKWAFVAIAMVQTKGLKPKHFPKLFGNDFFLVGYRIFVRYTNSSGKRLRGLYILKSETNKKIMEYLGNVFTQYKYTTTDIEQVILDNKIKFRSIKSDFDVEIENAGTISLPENSPFTNWKEARRFAGPLPFTFTYNPKTKEILIIEGIRQHWTPKPVKVIYQNFSFLKSPVFGGAVLANAFVIHEIPYYWKRGKIEYWNK